VSSSLTTALRQRFADGLDVVLRRRDPLIPPRRLRYVGEGDYAEVGDSWLGLLRSLALVRPDERVLDVGCGAGVLARPLHRHLGPGASYSGIDDDPSAIAWCESAYKDRPDFTFATTDGLLGDEFVLPFPDATFDVVVMHEHLPRLSPEAVAGRLREARRVLIAEGRLFATAYMLDESARAAIAEGTAAIAFGPDGDAPAGEDDGDEALHAVDEEWFLDRVADAGFKTAGIRHGSWTPREGAKAFPDIVVARL
jgi:SAM-dependent methyltransferase